MAKKTKEKELEEILEYLGNLVEKAEKLKKEADNWEVRQRGYFTGNIVPMPKSQWATHRIWHPLEMAVRYIRIKLGIEIPPIQIHELPEEEREELLRTIKNELTFLINYFHFLRDILTKDPDLWDKTTKSKIKEFEKDLNKIEEISLKLFKKKE